MKARRGPCADPTTLPIIRSLTLCPSFPQVTVRWEEADLRRSADTGVVGTCLRVPIPIPSARFFPANAFTSTADTLRG